MQEDSHDYAKRRAFETGKPYGVWALPNGQTVSAWNVNDAAYLACGYTHVAVYHGRTKMPKTAKTAADWARYYTQRARENVGYHLPGGPEASETKLRELGKLTPEIQRFREAHELLLKAEVLLFKKD